MKKFLVIKTTIVRSDEPFSSRAQVDQTVRIVGKNKLKEAKDETFNSRFFQVDIEVFPLETVEETEVQLETRIFGHTE